MSGRAWFFVGGLALGAGMSVLYLGSTLQDLQTRVAALEARSASSDAVAPPRIARAARSAGLDAPSLPPRPASPGSEAVAGAPAVAGGVTVEDHLWSEEGRAAIDDVVSEREAQEREQMRSRWQQMMAFRTERAVQQVVEELELSGEAAEDMKALVGGYMEQRAQRWRKMHEEDVDVPTLQEEAELAREAFEADVVEQVGEDGLELLQKALQRGRGL